MKKILSVTGFTALLTLLRMSSGFLIAKCVSIYAGPSGLAVLGQFQNFVGILNGIVTSPCNTGIVRYTAENINDGFDKCAPLWRSAVQWSFGLILIILPIGCFLSETISILLFSSKEYLWVILVSFLILPLSIFNTIILSITNGLQNYKRYIILGMISILISSSIMIYMIYNYNIRGALLSVAINSGILGGVLILLSLKQPWFKFKYFLGNAELKYKIKIGNYVLMSLTSTILAPLSLIFIRNTLANQVGWDLTGQWQAVWKISEVYLSVITVALSTYYLPRLSSLTGYNSILSEINKTAIVILPIVITLSFTIYIFRDYIVTLLFTSDFDKVSSFIGMQLIGDVIKVTAWLYAYPMISQGNSRWFISTEIIFTLIFCLLSFFLAKIYGINGVVISYVINYALYFIFIVANFKRIIK